jgi:hypothetical protein
MDDDPNQIEEKQDDKYKELRQEGKDPQAAANAAMPPETTGMRTETNQNDSPLKKVEGPAAEEE